MKKLIALFCVASAVTAFADTPAVSDNVFGVLRVDSTSAQTIVSIPWAEAGTGDPIKVKDAIKTTNLTKGTNEDGAGGDQLYLYSNGSYKLWQLNKDDVWVGATPVAGDDQYTAIAGSDTDTLSRGDALILVRKNPTNGDGSAKPFYLYGQYESVEDLETKLPAKAFSLIAPPKTEADTDGNIKLSDAKWNNITPNDHIILPSGLQLDWENGEWGKRTYSGSEDWDGTWSNTAAKIPMGQGVWFRAGAGDGKSVKW